jgi:hypothetical protein
MTVRVHIDRLVLDGFALSPVESRHVRAAVETELTRLLADGGLSDELRSGGAMPSVVAGRFEPSAGGSAAQLGAAIAQSVHGGLGKQR